MRLFIAIDLPENIHEKLANLCGGLAGAKWVASDQLHLTIRFIGEVNGGLQRELAANLETIRLAPFELTIHKLGHFSRGRQPQVLWAGITENQALKKLHRTIETKLQEVEIPREGRKFRPHITLARFKNGRSAAVGRFIAEQGSLKMASFVVDTFHLYSSVLTSNGAIHTIEQSYPLAVTEREHISRSIQLNDSPDH